MGTEGSVEVMLAVSIFETSSGGAEGREANDAEGEMVEWIEEEGKGSLETVASVGREG